MREHEKEFISALYLADKMGFNIDAIYAQAALESGWFQSSLCDVFNYWGIKWNPKRGATAIEKHTKEIVGGEEVGIIDRFQAFGTQYQAMTVYIEIIKSHYPRAYDHRDDPTLFYRGLSKIEVDSHGFTVNNGWSTSPLYSDKLIGCYESIKERDGFKALHQ